MSLQSGARLGPYEITGEIGAGGMGQVYKATDTRLDRTVAIKVLLDQLSGDPERRERFEREARAISSLNHPHICTLHDVGEQDGTHFLVMEYVEGETLHARLERGPLPLDEALAYGIQIADALAKAHRHGIVHRDLKPGNIMLTKGGSGGAGSAQVKLLDFGLAKVVGADDARAGAQDSSILMPTRTQASAPLTTEGSILGTLQYMSPEQLEGREADTRSDLFAFGAVLYEMVTGKKAFSGRSQASLIGAIMEHQPEPMADAQVLTPPVLERLVRRCLAKDPDDRWQSAADLAHELRWVAEGAGAGATTTDEAPPAGRGRERMVLIAAGLAVAAMAIVTAVTLMTTTGGAAVDAPPIRFDIATAPRGGQSMSISPDGRTIAFVAPFEDAPHVWLHSLQTGVAEPLDRTANGSRPFWSPDGRSLGFFADQTLSRIDLDGNVVTRLADAAVGGGGTWSAADGGVIVYAPTASGGLFKVPASGGDAVQLTQLAGRTTNDRLPEFLPDGRKFLYRTGAAQVSSLAVSSLDSGDAQELLADVDRAAYHRATGQILFTRQSTLFAQPFDPDRLTFSGDPVPLFEGALVTALSASAAGPVAYRATDDAVAEGTFAWFDRQGAELERFESVELRLSGSGADLALSPGGETLAYGGTSVPGLLDVESGIMTPIEVGTRFFVWSSDGSSYVFGDARDGTFDLYEQSVSGGDPTLLYASDLNELPLDLSTDGQFLLFRPVHTVTGYSLWALPLGPDAGDAFPVVDTDSVDRDGAFSPDGNWMAFQSNRTGQFEIFVQPFPGPGPARQVSTDGGTQVRWNGDGGELFYVASGNRMMAVPVTLPDDGGTVRTGPPVELFQSQMVSGARWQRQQYEVSADGQRFLMPIRLRPRESVPITVLLNLGRRE